MEVTYEQFIQLQNRVMLLEGGNATIQVIQEADVNELTGRFDRLLAYLEKFFNVGNISMSDIRRYVGSSNSSTATSASNSTSGNAEMDELRADVNALSRTLTETREDINGRIDRLLNYLETWINAGSLTMSDIKAEVEQTQ